MQQIEIKKIVVLCPVTIERYLDVSCHLNPQLR